MNIKLRRPSRRRAAIYGATLQTVGKVVGAMPIGPKPRRRLLLGFRRPSRQRANAYGMALQSAGTLVGSLPVTVTVRPQRRTVIRVVAPAAGVLALVVVVRRRSRAASYDGTQDPTAPFESASTTPTTSTGSDGTVQPPPAAEPPMVSPPTETEREKAQVGGGQLPPMPGETPHAAASETPAAGEAGPAGPGGGES